MAAAGAIQYLRNRAIYGIWLKRPPTALELHLPAVRWDTAKLPQRTAVEHAELPGLWLIRDSLDAVTCKRLQSLFTGLGSNMRATWYRYNFGRDMLPVHASPRLDIELANEILPTHVFGDDGSSGAKHEHWPSLDELLLEGVEGAKELKQLQDLPAMHVSGFRGQPCLFIQAQALESGAEVTAHKDPLPYGGHLIATAVLRGGSDVRVGSVRFRVETGDVYILADDARYNVEHEIEASMEPRISVTLRYGADFRPGSVLKPVGGDAPAADELQAS